MGYVKLVKNRAYFKNFRVKLRRRRECKTNYKRRRRLVAQDKRKFNAPKWRFIVRRTASDVICQVAAAKMNGDRILAAAYAHELKRYGMEVGLTNYAAHYATGLLLARRLLKKLKLDEYYKGKKKLDGKAYLANVAYVNWKKDDKIYRPFRCLLDIGLARVTDGGRVFAAMKGAVDGGLAIPHSSKRFPGYTRATEKGEKDSFDPTVLADKIYGGSTRDYMEHLQESDPEKYAKHFSRYIAAGIGPENLAAKWKAVHKEIRKNPAPAPKKKYDPANYDKTFPKPKRKLTGEERAKRRKKKIQGFATQRRKKKERKQLVKDRKKAAREAAEAGDKEKMEVDKE